MRRHVPDGMGVEYGPTRVPGRVSRARPLTGTKPDPSDELVDATDVDAGGAANAGSPSVISSDMVTAARNPRNRAPDRRNESKCTTPPSGRKRYTANAAKGRYSMT